MSKNTGVSRRGGVPSGGAARADAWTTDRASALVWPRLALLACAAALVAVALWAAPAAGAASVLHGINDTAAIALDPAARAQHLTEIKDQLHASVLRVNCEWPLAEPAQGQYTDAGGSGYLYDLEQTVQAANDLGLKVIVTSCFVPQWASDSSFWNNPPPGYSAGYQDFYPMTTAALSDYRAFAQHLSAALAGDVMGYEAYNEPNLWPYIYPQRTPGDAAFAAHVYLKYLKAFGAGVRAGDPHAKVIAGSTAPTGTNNIYWTSPQAFARALAAGGAAKYFDVYAHHPYVPGGPGDMDPRLPPVHPNHTVSLSNIGRLLAVFPKKPFYLTEYGFSTEPSVAFGPAVTEFQQAAYLSEAYALAARHPRIKLLVWQPLQDASPSGSPNDPNGCYLGLRRVDGSAKPAWYAFAGGNRIAFTAPPSARRGARIAIGGRYTCASVGGVRGKRLLVQRLVNGRWRGIRFVTTGSNGHFAARVSLGATQRLRVIFAGVTASRVRLVVARR